MNPTLVRTTLLRASLSCLIVLLQGVHASAQDDRREYPFLLSKGFVELNVGHITYPFSQAELEPGHTAESVDVPSLAVRLSFGYRFNDYVSTQLSYMRPARWVRYTNIDGDRSSHSVWMNVTGVTVTSRVPVKGPLSVHGEGGLGFVTRHGTDINGAAAVKDAVYPSVLLGGGVEYRLNREWGLTMTTVYSPARPSPPQPRTVFYSGGLTYRIDPLPSSRPAPDADAGYIFPKHLIQAAYVTNALGYGANTFMSPVFWQGGVEVRRGLALQYQRNVFHTKKVFSLDWGTSVAYKTSRQDGDGFLTVSIFPMFRFTAIRTKGADVYGSYSLAGPTFISKVVIDGEDTGKRFTLQDLVGVGIFAGKNRHMNVEVRIGHHSNGNLFPQNVGIKVPLTFSVGYAF